MVTQHVIDAGASTTVPEWPVSKVGPWEYGGALYVVLVMNMYTASAKTLNVYKSTDAGLTWLPKDSASGPTLSATVYNRNYDCDLNGAILYVCFIDTTDAVSIGSFDCATDTWGATIAGGPAIAASPGGPWPCGGFHGQVYYVYNPTASAHMVWHTGALENVGGTDRKRAKLSYYASAAWTLNQAVYGEGTTTSYSPSSICLGQSGRVHFFFIDESAILHHRSCNSDFTLNAHTQVATQIKSVNFPSVGHAQNFTIAGVQKIAVSFVWRTPGPYTTGAVPRWGPAIAIATEGITPSWKLDVGQFVYLPDRSTDTWNANPLFQYPDLECGFAVSGGIACLLCADWTTLRKQYVTASNEITTLTQTNWTNGNISGWSFPEKIAEDSSYFYGPWAMPLSGSVVGVVSTGSWTAYYYSFSATSFILPTNIPVQIDDSQFDPEAAGFPFENIGRSMERSHSGPWAIGNSFYALQKLMPLSPNATTENLQMWKSTDGGFTWSEQDAANHPTHGAFDQILELACLRVGTLIYVAYSHYTAPLQSNPDYLYLKIFDTSTDTWSAEFNEGSIDAAYLVDYLFLVEDSDGSILAVYNLYTKVLGVRDLPCRLRYSRFFSGAWVEWAVAIDDAAITEPAPVQVFMGSYGRIHIFYTQCSATFDEDMQVYYMTLINRVPSVHSIALLIGNSAESNPRDHIGRGMVMNGSIYIPFGQTVAYGDPTHRLTPHMLVGTPESAPVWNTYPLTADYTSLGGTAYQDGPPMTAVSALGQVQVLIRTIPVLDADSGIYQNKIQHLAGLASTWSIATTAYLSIDMQWGPAWQPDAIELPSSRILIGFDSSRRNTGYTFPYAVTVVPIPPGGGGHPGRPGRESCVVVPRTLPSPVLLMETEPKEKKGT